MISTGITKQTNVSVQTIADFRYVGNNVLVSNQYQPATDRTVKRILMLDDNPIDHFIHLHLLKQHGCRAAVTTVATVQEAIDRMQDHAYDIIVTDMSLEGEVGLDLVAYLEAIGCEIPVVILSSSRLTEDVEQSFGFSNVWAYLVKPLTEKGIALLLSGQ